MVICAAKGSCVPLISALLCVGILRNERAFFQQMSILFDWSVFILLHCVNCIVSTRGSVLVTALS